MKKTEYGSDARAQLSSGVKKLSKAVKSTLGPSGRNVLIKPKNGEPPFATKDGVTVAGNFSSEDVIEQVAIETIQMVSANTDNITGDGTTTATVIAEYILERGLNFPEHLNLLDIKKGIDKAVKIVVETLQEYATPCTTEVQLKQVALISSNYDENISDVVIEAFRISGKQGIVNIKRSRTMETFVSSIQGMNLPTGFRSRDYINDFDNGVCEFENPYVFMTNKKINEVTPNLEFLLAHCSENNEPLLIICKDMDVLVSNMLVQNKRKGSIKICVCRAPGFGNEQEDTLRDIGVTLGKEPFIENEAIDFDNLSQEDILEFIPRSESVLVTEQTLSIKAYEDNKPRMHARADLLREQLENHHNSYEKSLLQARISRLTDGIAFINIGAQTEMEFVEKQHRIQDALYAVKSANEEGIVPGGGAALFTISTWLQLPLNPSLAYGYKIVQEAIMMPLIQICDNAGVNVQVKPLIERSRFEKLMAFFDKGHRAGLKKLDSDFVEQIALNFDFGYNVKNEQVEDMIEAGIIDPVKVTRVALQNAASVSSLLLTTECVIVDEDAYDKKNLYNE